jgi:hypothetical protein
MMFIFSLPKDILHFLSHYFSIEKVVEEEIKTVFKFNSEWTNFLNTSKEYCGEWKKHSRIVVLKACYAEKYLNSSRFRERILQTIVDPLEQLELRCNFPDFRISPGITPVNSKFLGSIHKIAANQYRIADFPAHLTELSLRTCVLNPEDCPPLRTIQLDMCAVNGKNEIDVSRFQILEEASFTRMKIRNYHTLAHLKSVSIENDDSIVDVSCFRGVKKLRFNFCRNITDVSSLGNVHHLNLGHCDGITDVSSLGTIKDLTLISCDNVTDVSALGNVPVLNIGWCTKVKDISCLRNVRELRLYVFKGNYNLSNLENTQTLSLRYSQDLSIISMPKNIQELDIYGLPKDNRI